MWDKIIKKILDVSKVMAVISPTLMIATTFIYKDIIISNIVDIMKPDIILAFKDEVKPAVVEALTENPVVTKIDSSQMNEILVMMMEYQQATLDAIPVMIVKYIKLENSKEFRKVHEVYDSRTGEHLWNLVGIKQEGGKWFVYLENVKK